jgi:hypothetical protein
VIKMVGKIGLQLHVTALYEGYADILYFTINNCVGALELLVNLGNRAISMHVYPVRNEKGMTSRF